MMSTPTPKYNVSQAEQEWYLWRWNGVGLVESTLSKHARNARNVASTAQGIIIGTSALVVRKKCGEQLLVVRGYI
jgi:hypothetical protein